MLVFRTQQAIPEVGALSGDLILIDPTDTENPAAVYRSLDSELLPVVLSRLDSLELLSQSAPPALPATERRGSAEELLPEDGEPTTALVRSLRRLGLWE